MKIYDVSVIPESSKIEIFKLAVKEMTVVTYDDILNSYAKLLEIYFAVNKDFDENHINNKRHGIMIDMEREQS